MNDQENEENEKYEENKETDECKNNEDDDDNLRELILQQLTNLEQSEVSDDDSYKVRLSCILEDDESESSGANQKDNKKSSEMNKESEKGPPGEERNWSNVRLSGLYDSETSDDMVGDIVQVTDLDDDTSTGTAVIKKTKECVDIDKVDGAASEESDEFGKRDGFSIKKLKSSDNVHKRPFLIRKRELSSDSSDFDISVTNSAEGAPNDKKKIEINEVDDENTLNIAPEIVEGDLETSADEDLEPKLKDDQDVEVLDNKTLSSIFAKVSKTYLEKTKGHVKWEENEKIYKPYEEAIERSRSSERQTGDQLSLRDIHIRGTSPKEYNPPVPPETYLWEELKRLRERGGYPWTYLDKPPFDEATWKKYMEHVYEPINPPPLEAERNLSREELTLTSISSKGSSIPETEKHSVRIPSENNLMNKEKSLEVMEVEITSPLRETHTDQKENTSKESLENDMNTSNVSNAVNINSEATMSEEPVTKESPMFKDLPLKHGTLHKTRREQMREQAQDIQKKLRDRAGRIRTKFNSIQRPSHNRESTSEGEKLKFKLPEMRVPKINLPDRSKFKLPEKSKFHFPEAPKLHFPDKAKFHLPDSAKFHLPDRSKFHLPERSKFHLPESAKLHLPDRSKFHLPERPKFNLAEKIHLPERGKFHLPDKSKFRLPDKAKLHLPEGAKFHFEKPKFHLPEKAKFHLPKRPHLSHPKIEIPRFKRSKDAQSPSTSSLSKFDLKTYPKLFRKNSKDYTTSSPKQTRGRTPPPRMHEYEMPQTTSSEKWMKKLDVLQYADEDLEKDEVRETDSRKSESLIDYQEKNIDYPEDYEKEPTDGMKIYSRLSDKNLNYESSNDRKKGVLEEINCDEYFLRQKGISQDDIDMGQYLSHEIREAFRSPDMNALKGMDYLDDENTHPQLQIQPQRPTRTSSVKKKSILKKSSRSDPSISDAGYKTYPPKRPGRKSRSQSKSLLNEDAAIPEPYLNYETSNISHKYDNDEDEDIEDNVNVNYEVEMSKYDNVDFEEDVSEYYKVPGPAKEYEYYNVPRSHKPVSSSPLNLSKSSIENEFLNEKNWSTMEITCEPPVPMARKKKIKKNKVKKSELADEEQIPQQIVQELQQEAILQTQNFESSPIPPKRTRSSRSRSLRSFVTEEEISVSFQSDLTTEKIESEIQEDNIQPVEEGITRLQSDFEAFEPSKCQVTDLDDPGFGYATVGKTTVVKPQRQKKKKKPERPPPPKRKKEVAVPIYSTYPRKAPVRPLRNYSTLGPSRPPRRNKRVFTKEINAGDAFSTYSEVQKKTLPELTSLIEVLDSSKELQTEKVFEKMKGRPLPPPPRPPRQKSKGPDDQELKEEEKEQIALSILKDEEFPFERQVTVFVHEPPTEKEEVEEVCVSNQATAPVEEFCVEKENKDVLNSAEDVSNSNLMQEFSHEQLRIQQAFLEEMKREEEELRKRGIANDNDMVDAELKAEVIRQIEDIIQEERRILAERKEEENTAGIQQEDLKTIEKKLDNNKKESNLDVDLDSDMGYASLDRKSHRISQSISHSQVNPEIPQKLEKLQVDELEAGSISVHEVKASQIFVKELQSNRIASQDIDNTGGNMVLGSINLPDSIIDQIIAKIPWEALRQSNEQNQSQNQNARESQVQSLSYDQKQNQDQSSTQELPQPVPLLPVRPHRRQRGFHVEDDSEDEEYFQPRKTLRKHHTPQVSNDNEDKQEKKQMVKVSTSNPDIAELSIQLVRACTAVGAQAVRNFIDANAAFASSLDREMCVQAVLCIAIALVAAFFLFGFDAKIIHVNHWDFQFPPQPPKSSGM